MVIYKLTNKINGMVYIGQTHNIKRRIAAHKSDAKGFILGVYKRNSYIVRAIAKYGFENFSLEIIQEGFKTQEEMDNAEVYWVSKYNSTDSNFGYNIQKGGHGVGKMSENSKRLLSIAHLGKKQSEETRKRNSLSKIGKKHSPETIEKIKTALTGRKCSKEHIRNNALARTGKKMPDTTKEKMSLIKMKLSFEEQLLIHDKYINGNITQKQLAEEYGVDDSTICRVINRIKKYLERTQSEKISQ